MTARPPTKNHSRAYDRTRFRAFVFGITLVAALAAFSAQAQEGSSEPDPWAGVEEMVVTGSTTAALLNPASTSAVAFDSEALDAYGVESVDDIAAYVPNLEIRSQNATNASFFIRGVGLQDFGANSTSAVPIIQDGIIRNPSATQLVGLFDVGGLSVLRGPQASGNHRNASAGAIILETAKPEPEFSAYAQASVFTLTSVDAVDAPRYEFETAMSAPLYEDIVSMRLSARYSRETPWFENACANRIPEAGRTTAGFFRDADAQICETVTNTDAFGNVTGLDGEGIDPGDASAVAPFLDKRIGEVDDFGFRAQLRIQPPDTGVDMVLRAEISQLNRDSTVGLHLGTGGGLGGVQFGGYRKGTIVLRERQLVAAGLSATEVSEYLAFELRNNRGDSRPYAGAFDSPGRTIVDTLSLSATTNVEFDDFQLEVNAGYLDYRKSEIRDTDLSPDRLFPSQGNDQAWEAYGSFNFSGEELANQPVSWNAGGWTIFENVEAYQNQFLFTGRERRNLFTQRTYGFGLFADFEYELLESLTVSGGVRYNWERKGFTADDIEKVFLVFLNDFVFPREGSRNQRTWDAFTGFVKLRYDFTEDVAVYMSYTRGFKAGHFNPSRPDSADIPGVGFADPEEIDALEWGAEFAAWDGRISGSGALFFYNYRNYQVFRLTSTFGGVFREVQNAERARNLGAELSLQIRPLEGLVPPEIEGLQIRFEGGWLQTEYIDFVTFDQRLFTGFQFNIAVDNSQNPLISAAQLQATVGVTWPIVLERFGTITPQYDMTWTDDTPFDPNRGRGQRDIFSVSNFEPFLIGNPAYALHNVRLTYEPPGDRSIRMSGWCRNVTDQRYSNFSVDLSTFVQSQLHYLADPRTCGADVRFSF